MPLSKRSLNLYMLLIAMVITMIFGIACSSVFANSAYAENASQQGHSSSLIASKSSKPQIASSATSNSKSLTLSASASSSKGSSSNSSKAKKNGLVKKGSNLYYYEAGKKAKSSWKKLKGKSYYFGSNGKAVSGVKKISGALYLFNASHTLYRSKKSVALVTRGKRTYCVAKNGRVLTDWQLVNNKLYHFNGKGVMTKKSVVDEVSLASNGKAASTKAAKAKIAALKALNKVVSVDESRTKKLKAAWNYVTSRSKFRYASIYPNLSKKNWQYDTAYSMLSTRMGNCYSFACAFAAMAEVIGYDPKIALGRVHGDRDHAGDGFTRHSWVVINGKHYDPEIKYSGVYTIYGPTIYPMVTKSVRYVNF